MTLRIKEDTGNSKKKHKCAEPTLEKAMDFLYDRQQNE